MSRATIPLNFNAFLEKAKLKDDGSNYSDWVHNLRIILIAAQKNYVFHAPLGDTQEQMQTLWMFGKLDMMTT